MDLSLTNKVFIITGGGAGIGEAITLGAAIEGAKVAILGRSEIAGTNIEKSLNEKKADFLFVKTELSDAYQCKNAIQTVIEKYGKIDVLVNNAGVNDSVGLENGSPDAFIASMHKNLFHYYYMAHYALPYLKKSKGNIVNISSKTADTGQGGTSGYAASKGAQNALTREWAVEMLPFQIRVNCVIPAEVYTPLYEKWISSFPNKEERLKKITSKIPLENRFTTSEEIANMVLFLASEKSAHTTGQIVYVDGGYTHLDRAL
ncbi:MAG: SDR family oxidoreductase [Bacteroidota bacterium]|nr:SDR family oxidoreductase [Bacteroidota bacterium]